MSTTARVPKVSNFGSTQQSASKMFSMSDISSRSKPLPSRYAFHSGPGFGKTSMAAYAPSPIFMQTKGETGLETLIQSGQLPEVPHFPEIETWGDLNAAVSFLRKEEHSFKTLVLDTANGAERMLHEYVADRDFDGDWTDRGFMGYMRGYEVALADWRMFLNSLDDLRKDRNMTVFFLVHTKIKTFKNPSGADYDRYSPEMHDKTWALTKGWLDCILFGNFEVTVKAGNRIADASKKGKAVETAARILYTNSDNPTFDAKNRFGLPDEIEMGSSPKEAWDNFATAIKNSRKAEGK